METLAAAGTIGRPKRRPGLSRRASMSALPSYSSSRGHGKFGFDKKELQAAYKSEKKLRKKAHEQAEKNMRQTIESVQYEPVSGLAEQNETMATRVSLTTFDRPKASRKSRRASLGMTLRILTPPTSPKLDLEDIEPVNITSLMDTTSPLLTLPRAPVLATPATTDSGPIMNRRGMLQRSMSCQLDAETLAGWKTILFSGGPLGMQLEPTVGYKAARVTAFLDTNGVPSVAGATGRIEFNDIIVKVNAAVPKSFDEALFLLSQGGKRSITFRPAFSYEVDEEALRKSINKNKSSKKKKDKKKKDTKSASLLQKKKKKDKLESTFKHNKSGGEDESKPGDDNESSSCGSESDTTSMHTADDE